MRAPEQHVTTREPPRPASRGPRTAPAALRPGSTGYLQRQLGNRLVREVVSPSAPRLQRACACGGTCAHCGDERGEHLSGSTQRKP